jgi:hypothetical protein
MRDFIWWCAEHFHAWLFDFMCAHGLILLGSKGGGSSAPAPDPRLVEAQIRSMGIQDEQVRRIVDLQDRMQPLQEEQMQFGLDSARTAFDQSQADRTWSLGRRSALSGLQDSLVADANSFNVGNREADLAAKAGADYRAAADRASQSSARAMARYGISSGKSEDIQAQLELGRAAGEAGAITSARGAARAEKYALTDRATNALAGYPAMGMQATGQGMGAGMAGLGIVNQGIGAMNSSYMSAGQLAGQMGANATSMWGAQGNYKLSQDRMAQDDGGFMGLIGTLGGAAITKYSDRRLKVDIERLADDPRGFGWYQFRYVWGGAKQIGVMADEIARVIPGAVGQSGGFYTVNYSML